jgi:Golgi nucleoside diphosphatase
MRQLHEEKMNDAVRFIDTLMRNRSFNPFLYDSSTNSRILSGEEEGVFAWITVNYLNGTFSGKYPSCTESLLSTFVRAALR